MMEINLIPHNGVEIQNAGKISFGQTPDMVEKILGAPSFKRLYETYSYDVYDGMKICFDADKRVEFIECNYPYFGKTRTLIYGADFFSLLADEAIELLEKRNNGRIAYESLIKPKKSLYFLEIDVAIWRDFDETDAAEIRRGIVAGEYGTDTQSYENDARLAHYFKSVGIGKKGYFGHCAL